MIFFPVYFRYVVVSRIKAEERSPVPFQLKIDSILKAFFATLSRGVVEQECIIKNVGSHRDGKE